MSGLLKFLELIKFSHTLFALPFALMGAVLGFRQRGPQEMSLYAELLFWVVVAMAGARTGAMGFNRLVDRRFDAANPRTEARPSVTGEVSTPVMIGMILLSYGLLVFAASQLNPLAFYLSPLAIFLVSFYSYTKRFTAWCHLFLGLAIGASPIAAWIAITGTLEPAALVLGASVMAWISGFDILYALQDREFDQSAGLHSIPVALGVRASLITAKGLHLIAALAWFALAYLLQLGWPFWAGAVLASLLLALEHGLVQGGKLGKINLAFFNLNAVISALLFFALLLEGWVG
ncbi:MAG: UbiA-like polyprenyltransferase [bacterium]|nr:UbiA-like polyprenyltransferase [bacterium]